VKSNNFKKVVVTGASGFIGSNILQLAQDYPDHDFIPLSRKKLPNHFFVENYTLSPKADVLIYLSQENKKDITSDDTQRYLKDNINILQKIIRNNYKKFIYISSSSLYGDANNFKNKTESPLIVDNLYAELKFNSEKIVLEHPSGIVVRLSNVYGRGMSKFNVVSKIINQIPGDDNLTILTSEPIRDFVWITDVTKGIMELADTGLDKFSKRRVFNISTGVGTSIGEMANLALKIAGESNRKVVSDKTLSRISKNVVDYSVINGLTGWKPTMTLESGLTNLIDSKIKVTN